MVRSVGVLGLCRAVLPMTATMSVRTVITVPGP